MIATQIAPLTQWYAIASSIGITWKGRGFTDENPVVSTWVEAAYKQNPNGCLKDLLLRASRLQINDNLEKERDRYYERLPRFGEHWRPHAHAGEELVVWTVRRSFGNHQAYFRDLTATVAVREDGVVVPAIRDGLGNSIAEMMLACPAGTPHAMAVRQLIVAERRLRQALTALLEAMHPWST